MDYNKITEDALFNVEDVAVLLDYSFGKYKN